LDSVKLALLSNTPNVGSRLWMAPEVKHDDYDAFLSDIYSMGLVLYELLNNNLPEWDEEMAIGRIPFPKAEVLVYIYIDILSIEIIIILYIVIIYFGIATFNAFNGVSSKRLFDKLFKILCTMVLCLCLLGQVSFVL